MDIDRMFNFLAGLSTVRRLAGSVVAVLALLWLGSCSVYDTADFPEQLERNEFVAEAQRLFAEKVTGNPKAGFNERGMMPLGEMAPVWQRARMSSAKTLIALDVPLRTQYRYRALYAVGEDAIQVPIYHNLVVVKSPATGKIAQYLHYYIPNADYGKRNDKDLTEQFSNCGSRGDYCGLEIYTDELGKIWRINKYEKGVKTDGVYMGNPELSAAEKRRAKGRLMGGLWIQQGRRKTATGSRNDNHKYVRVDGDSVLIDGAYYAPARLVSDDNRR